MMYANDDVFGVRVNKTVKASGVRQALDQVLAGTGLNYTIDKQFVTIKKSLLSEARHRQATLSSSTDTSTTRAASTCRESPS